MVKKKKTSATNEEEHEKKKILVAIYPEEFKSVEDTISTECSSKNIRDFFGLQPTHRQRTGMELREELKDMTTEEKKELLEQIRKKKEE